MDPKLIAALREYLQMAESLKEQGVTVTPENVEEFFRVKTEGKFGFEDAQKALQEISTDINPRNMARSAIQGASFNFGDELLGALPEFLGGGDAAKEEMRLREQLFREKHPVAEGLGQLAGGLLVPGLGGAKAVKGAVNTAQAVRRGAAIGSGAGLLSGVGSGEGLEERAAQGAIGAGAGGLLGAGAPAVAAGVKYVGPTARAGRRMASALEGSGGIPNLQRELGEFTAAGRGDETMLLDLSDRLLAEADFAANASDDVRVPLSQRLHTRQEGATGRLLGDVRERVGDPIARAESKARRKALSEFAASDEGFTGLRKKYKQLPNPHEFAEVLNQPRVSKMWKDAQEMGFVGEFPDVGKPSFEHVHSVKRDLDAAVTQAYNKGNVPFAERLQSVRDELEDLITKRVPEYEKINEKYGLGKKEIESIKNGIKAWRTPGTRDLQAVMADLPPQAQKTFRMAMASELIDRLRSRDLAKKEAAALMKGSPELQDKLKVVFGDEKTFRSFMDRAAKEARFARAFEAVGGSATARRQAAQGFDPAETAADVAASGGFWSLPVRAMRFGAREGEKAISRRTAAKMGPQLMTQGSNAIEELLRTFSQPAPLAGPTAGGRLPAGLGGLLGYELGQ